MIIVLYIPLDVVTYLSNATSDDGFSAQRAPECIFGRNGRDGCASHGVELGKVA